MSATHPCYTGAIAAKKNGGLVIVGVSSVIDKEEQSIFLPADVVDFICVHPQVEQTAGIPMSRFWPLFTLHSDVDITTGWDRLKFINNVIRVTPTRSQIQLATARLAASLFAKVVKKNSLVNIGVGLPEEVCRILFQSELFNSITFFTETGVVGGT